MFVYMYHMCMSEVFVCMCVYVCGVYVVCVYVLLCLCMSVYVVYICVCICVHGVYLCVYVCSVCVVCWCVGAGIHLCMCPVHVVAKCRTQVLFFRHHLPVCYFCLFEGWGTDFHLGFAH